MYKSIAGILIAVCCLNVNADSLTEVKTVKRLFSEGISSAGFMANEGFNQCLFEIMYLDLSKDSGKAQFSMLLSAKATGQKIVRIDYSVQSNGMCTLSALHVE